MVSVKLGPPESALPTLPMLSAWAVELLVSGIHVQGHERGKDQGETRGGQGALREHLQGQAEPEATGAEPEA